ncbi:hypothetical protein [Natronococcus jeotgali]|uniref:Small CPxCG-related zinc finger protein n=1 Tax=Natronococcus jeotgali DSM 18795 TaxID=1227498 RepID=L9WMT0_9EURY|nr:hypothetical protein [Natronococcus jeotgali]ELY50795.1 hypothetical protein C492_21497 [Natronococcus jeotgali DSM 18795]
MTRDGPDAASTLPDCPVCGRPIATVTLTGPTDGVVSPCGCRIVPVALE